MKALLDHGLIVVTGKGGVGRTTATAALGFAAARQGKRVCVVELSGQSSLARTVGFPDGQYEAREVMPGLMVMSMSPTACLADFGRRKLRVSALARLFFESRVMTGFVEAVPGLNDIVQLGKIENMLHEPLAGEPVFDLVVLDAPATGHGLTLLAAARSMREMTGVGPFHDLAAIIERLLEDPERTATVLVTLPEALPVAESLELVEALTREHAPPRAVLVNQVAPPWPHDVPEEAMLQALGAPSVAHRVAREALEKVAISTLRGARRNAEALDRLRAGLPAAAGVAVPVVTMPRVDDPNHLRPLADALQRFLALQGGPMRVP